MRLSKRVKTEYDIVILGGGPAGCATALALCQKGISSILVVESGNYEAFRIGESIPPDTHILLEKLGVWKGFQEEHYERCLGSVSSWGNDELGYNDFLFNPNGVGWHLDRRRFDQYMAKCAVNKGIDLLTGTRYISHKQTGDKSFTLAFSSEKEDTTTCVSASFVVDATGNRAVFAHSEGSQRTIYDQLTCIYGFFNVPADSDFSQLTILEAVEYGWWYGAKLPDGQLAIALSTDPLFFKQKKLHKWENWLTFLSYTRHISKRLSGCVFKKDELLIAPVIGYLMDTVIGDRWLATGDAASTFDPISAQGIHKALTDALEAAEAIIACFQGNGYKPENYQNHIILQYENYLENRNYFYDLEQRWSDSPFWIKHRNKAKRSMVPGTS